MENELETLIILTPGFPADENDTTCLPPRQLFVKTLKEICPDLNIIVVAFQYPYTKVAYKWFGVNVKPIGGKNKGRGFRAVTWIKAWTILKKIKKENQIVGLLSFWLGECAFVGSVFSKRYKVSHYSWILGQDAKRHNKYFKWIKPKGNSLIALSDFVRNEVKRNYGIVPFEVIPVGVDTTLFKPAFLTRDIDILGAGSLIPLKQYHLFVEHIRDLKQYFPHIKAVICGKGPELERLQKLASSFDLENNLTFAGELPHIAVIELMQRSKIFLHTSNYEGFGTVLAEALYAGAHVVSFCKPMADDFDHLYTAKNKEEMNNKLLALLRNSRLNHDRVLMYGIKQVAKSVISLFGS